MIQQKAGSASDTFILPLIGSGYNFNVDWGDSSDDDITISSDPALTHVYSLGGVYNIKITGSFPTIYFNGGGDKLKITDITNWGSTGINTLYRSFQGCSNLIISAVDGSDVASSEYACIFLFLHFFSGWCR